METIHTAPGRNRHRELPRKKPNQTGRKAHALEADAGVGVRAGGVNRLQRNADEGEEHGGCVERVPVLALRYHMTSGDHQSGRVAGLVRGGERRDVVASDGDLDPASIAVDDAAGGGREADRPAVTMPANRCRLPDSGLLTTRPRLAVSPGAALAMSQQTA